MVSLSLHALQAAKLQHIIQLGETPLLQAGKNLRIIDHYRKFAFLLASGDHHLDRWQFFLQFRSETRCARLVPSGGAIDNLDCHLELPFFV